MSDDIAAFAIARLDEAETAVRVAGEAPVAWLTCRDSSGQMLLAAVAAKDALVREVRKIEAMRGIVQRYQAQSALAGRNVMEEDRAWALWLPVAYLAAIWSDHPDYQEEYTP